MNTNRFLLMALVWGLFLLSHEAIAGWWEPFSGGNANSAFTKEDAECSAIPLAATFTTSDGSKIRYETAGCGTPLLLIHGGDTVTRRDPYSASDFKASQSWEPQFSEFAKTFRVIRYDIRGFGQSTSTTGHPIDNWEWSDNPDPTVQDALELLQHLGIGKAHVVGLSIGSGIAAQLAVYHPELVDKLVLISPWFQHSLSFSSQQQTDALNAIKDKTLLIVGANDNFAQMEARQAQSSGYQPRMETISDAEHFCNSDQPAIFNKLVMNFLGSARQDADKILSTEFGWGDTPEQFGLQQGEEIETLGAHTFSEDAQGNKYIADPVNKRIKVLDSQGRYQRNIPIDTFPQDILVDRQGILVLDENGLTWQNRRYPLSPEVPVLEGYGQGLWQDYENSVYVCKAQECYMIIDNSSGRQRVLSPQEQFASVMPGYPLKDGNWLRTEWLNPKQARIVIFTPDEVLKEIPLETTDSFGAVSFLGEDRQGRLHLEIERITVDQTVYLDLRTYDQEGTLLGSREFPNDYFSTVYKKLSINRDNGEVQQMYCTREGVKYEVSEPIVLNTDKASVVDVSGIWTWTCCNDAYRGKMSLIQEGTVISGKFYETSNGTEGIVQGEVNGTHLTFTRKWGSNTQFYELNFDASKNILNGTFRGNRDTSVGVEFSATRKTDSDEYTPTKPPAPKPAGKQGNRIDRYIVYDDGTALDTVTGLMWMRCSMGQTWTNGTCQGTENKYTWTEASQLAYTYAGYKDWRAPTVQELTTLIYCTNREPLSFVKSKISGGLYLGCKENSVPAVVQDIFPNTLTAVGYWTSSSRGIYDYSGWGVYFGDGAGISYDDIKSHGKYVRLVRGSSSVIEQEPNPASSSASWGKQ